MTETRKTFIIPDGHYAVRDADGRATGETRPIEPATTNPVGWPNRLTVRDTKVQADEGQRIYSTATGHGYEKCEYVRADITAAIIESLHDLLTRPTDPAARQRARAAITTMQGVGCGKSAITGEIEIPIKTNVVVRPLDWKTDCYGTQTAVYAFGSYSCPRFHDQWDLLVDGRHFHPRIAGVIEAYPSIEDAKAAAQADYESRVRSCLTEAGDAKT